MLFEEEGVSILLSEIYNIYEDMQATLWRAKNVYDTEMPDGKSKTEWEKY